MNSLNYIKIVKIMVKRFKQFVNENVNNPDSYLDSKMQEIKDMISAIDNSTSLIYDWENKNDHELYVNFSKDDLSIRYEFDIDDLKLTKIAGGVTDFQTSVDSIDAGINMIESDINSILGVNEGLMDIFSNKNKKENLFIWVRDLKSKIFIEFSSYTSQDKKVNKLLIQKISDNLSLNFTDAPLNSFSPNRLKEVLEYLKNIGLEYKDVSGDKYKVYVFKGELSLNDLK
jgi:hypothetical protein